jgi:hypothetical protein
MMFTEFSRFERASTPLPKATQQQGLTSSREANLVFGWEHLAMHQGLLPTPSLQQDQKHEH